MTTNIQVKKVKEDWHTIQVNGELVAKVSDFRVYWHNTDRCFVARIEYHRAALGKTHVDEFRDFTLTME